jgi:hypothetical protein
VREESFNQTFATICDMLPGLQTPIAARPCFWGGPYGAKLGQGLSIPKHDSNRGIGDVTDKEYILTLWSMLYQDPLYELRTLSLQTGAPASFRPGQVPPNQALKQRARTFPLTQELRDKLCDAQLDGVFEAARKAVVDSPAFGDALQATSSDLDPYYDAIARAFVAQAISLRAQQGALPPVAIDAERRDALVDLIAGELGKVGSARGFRGWATKQLLGLAFNVGAFGFVERQRRALTDAAYPAAADIMLYQGNGAEIRRCIRACIDEAAQADPPVIVLAHSLGGIAAVDVLALEPCPEVTLLVTAGTQAPLFYEINALHSLRNGDPLPEHFPRWLNIYDPHDYLSYVAADLFQGRRVKDVPVDSRQPFPYSHGAYWTNPKTWEAVQQSWAKAMTEVA